MKITVATLLGCVLLATSSCKKEDTVQPVTPPSKETGITRMEADASVYQMSYDATGRIHKIVVTDTGTLNSNTYQFTYNAGLLDEVSFTAGGKWKYYYTATKLVKVETINDQGVIRYRREFEYNDKNQVSETREYRINASGNVAPQYKMTFTYDVKGNIAQKFIYYFINADWRLEEVVRSLQFDDHPNTSIHLESFPFLPAGLFNGNNPVYEEIINDIGVVDTRVYYTYQYDAGGRPVSRTTKYTYTGFPDTYSSLKLFY